MQRHGELDRLLRFALGGDADRLAVMRTLLPRILPSAPNLSKVVWRTADPQLRFDIYRSMHETVNGGPAALSLGGGVAHGLCSAVTVLDVDRSLQDAVSVLLEKPEYA